MMQVDVYIIAPRGTGKTMLAEALSKALPVIFKSDAPVGKVLQEHHLNIKVQIVSCNEEGGQTYPEHTFYVHPRA